MLRIKSILAAQKKIIQNLSWLTLDKIVRMGLGLIVAILMARYLGPENFGLFNYALSVVAIIGVVAGLGLDGICTREIVRKKDAAEGIIATAVTLKFLGSLLAISLLAIGIVILNPEDSFTSLLIVLLSMTLLFKATEAIKSWFESEVDSRYTVWAENLAFTVSGLSKIGLILAQLELIYFALAVVLESILAAVSLVLLYRFKGNRIHLSAASLKVAKLLLKESWPLMLSSVAIIIYVRIDLIMLKIFSGTHEVGIYAAATKISEAWYFLPMIICSTFAPKIILAHQADKEDYRNLLGKLYFFLFWFALVLTAGFALGSKQLIHLLYGAEYNTSASVLSIHFLASISVFLGVASNQYLLTENLQKLCLFRSVTGAISNVGLNLILIPKYGALGAAIATTLSYTISLLAISVFKVTRAHTRHLLSAPFMFRTALNIK